MSQPELTDHPAEAGTGADRSRGEASEPVDLLLIRRCQLVQVGQLGQNGSPVLLGFARW